jgi:hypothetical protein
MRSTWAQTVTNPSIPSRIGPRRQPRRRLRFSIRGIFILTLGVAVGLAWRRVPGASVPDALLSALATWFAIGMVQYAARKGLCARDTHVETQVRHGADAVAAIAIAAVIPLCLILSAISRSAIVSDESRDFLVSHAAKEFGDASILLAICCGYGLTHGAPRAVDSKQRAGGRTIRAFALLAAALWISWVVLNETLITSLVHTAIQGVEHARPTRWVGHVLQDWSPTDKLAGQFVANAYFSSGLLVIAIAVVVTMCRNWERGRLVRSGLAAAAAVCIAGELALIAWCRSVLPTIAPLEAALIGGQPVLNQLQALTLIFIAATAATWRLTAVRLSLETVNDGQESGRDNRPIHLRTPILWLGVIVIVWQYWDEVQFAALFATSFAALADLAAVWLEPLMILQLALLIIFVSSLWRRWRGKQIERPARWSVNPAMFMTTWLILFCVALVTPAIAAWYGVALYLHLGMT